MPGTVPGSGKPTRSFPTVIVTPVAIVVSLKVTEREAAGEENPQLTRAACCPGRGGACHPSARTRHLGRRCLFVLRQRGLGWRRLVRVRALQLALEARDARACVCVCV